MDGPVYEEDLTTIRARHATPLVRLRDRTAIALAQLNAATGEGMMQSALAELEAVADIVGALFFPGEIYEHDIPFGEIRMAWVCGPRPSVSRVNRHHSSYDEESGAQSDDSSNWGEQTDDTRSSLGSDTEVDCLALMDLASQCSSASFAELRNLHYLYYSIHTYRMDRLILRLGDAINATVGAPPHRPGSPIRQPPPPPPDAVINGPKESPPQDEPGARLSEEREAQYACVLADEVGCVAEYKRAAVGVIAREYSLTQGVA